MIILSDLGSVRHALTMAPGSPDQPVISAVATLGPAINTFTLHTGYTAGVRTTGADRREQRPGISFAGGRHATVLRDGTQIEVWSEQGPTWFGSSTASSMTTRERNISALICPSCGQTVTYQEGMIECTACSETVPVSDGIPKFPVADDQSESQTFFDLLSLIYESSLYFPVMYRVIAGPFAPADDRATVAAFLDASGDDVLDVACGTGRFTRYIAEQASFVWGIDVSEGMLEQAQEYAQRDGIENILFARMAADELFFTSATFDSVACGWALHLFPDIPAALTEMNRVLKPGGRLAGTTLTDDYLLAIPGIQQTLGQLVGAYTFEKEELRTLLLETGFTTVTFNRHGAALFFVAHAQ